MAHQINYNERTGRHSFFSVKEIPWHGLGTIVQEYPNSQQALEYAELDFEVEKRELYAVGDSQIDVPDYYATVRTDTNEALGVVGKDYQIVQNVNAFDFFDSIVGSKTGILYETAGALGRGERIFITAKLPDYIKVGKNDLIEQYLFLTTSHNGSSSITAAFTPIRVVCNNTLNAALQGVTNAVRIRHTVNVHWKLKEAHKLLGISNRLNKELGDIFNHWSKVRITDKHVKRLIQLALAPNKETLNTLYQDRDEKLSAMFNNMVSSVMDYALTSPSQDFDTTKGTLYGCYNAVTGYFQNVRNYKDDESKLKSIMFGTASQRAQVAFDLCHGYAQVGAGVLN